MKKITRLLVALALFATLFTNAQNEGDIKLGAGLSYGFDIEEIGIQANGYYTLDEKMRVGADFNYFLTGGNDAVDLTAWEFNGNFHYIFSRENEMVLYGLGSLGFHYSKAEVSLLGNTSSSTSSDIGFGIGGGIEYDLGNLLLFGEPRLFLSGFEQLAITVGIRFPL